MEFGFDPEKGKINKQKHGIDFIEAQILWKDPDRLEIPAKTVDEQRFLVIGRINEKLWSAVIAYRDDKTRIISVRRSQDSEVKIYEGQGI